MRLSRYLYKIAKAVLKSVKYLFDISSTAKVNCHEFYFFYTQYKMHITPISLKNYSFCNFLNRSKSAFVCIFSKKNFSPQKMFMSCFCLRDGAYLNGTSNVFTYL